MYWQLVERDIAIVPDEVQYHAHYHSTVRHTCMAAAEILIY